MWACEDLHDNMLTRPQVFQEIYDATSAYTAKKDMPKIQLTDLSIGDLVLVECWLVRGRTDERVPGVWSTWVTAFQLRAVSILLPRPVDPAERVDSEADDVLDITL